MKFSKSLLVAALTCAPRAGDAIKFVATSANSASPVDQVVDLLGELKTHIESDGVAEQTSYDKFACWCEDTLAAKAQDITSSKNTIEELRTDMVKLSGELGAHTVEIAQLDKDIAANIESQKEATTIRGKEGNEYEEEKTESEQCIGALEAAINVLNGPGTKKGFLETLQQAQLLSVVAGVRDVLRRPTVEKSVTEQDMQVMRNFVERPTDFVGKGAQGLSAAQVKNNPFGDYAPQSTQIQGILKGMYDTFHGDLEKSNAEEAQKEKAFRELMATKQRELDTLRTTLQTHTTDKATKSKTLADSRVELEDTQRQLEADETFFTQTKGSCQDKASEWATRTRYRTEELSGIAQAIAILSSDEAKETFGNATSLFQVDADGGKHARNEAYDRLKRLAGTYQNLHIAQLAVRVKAGGHFDEVIATIDNMIKVLQAEEQQDIQQRDWCEAKETKNSNDIEDLGRDINKATAAIGRMGDETTELGTKVGALETDINTTKDNIQELLNMRVSEKEAFVQGVRDDTKAVELLETAIAHLSRYYSKQKPTASFLETENSTFAPETSWSGSYAKREGEGRGVVAILTMIKEDLQKEIKVARQDDASAQTNYESDSKALRSTLSAQTMSKTALDKAVADLGLKIVDTEEYKGRKGEDLTSENDRKAALVTNCAWVQSHFQLRRDNRKSEIAGLVDAKNYLAGVDMD